jgi:hypothetical protein
VIEQTIAYAYVDLADHGDVPLSDGTMKHFHDPNHFLSAITNDGRRVEAASGAEALRVAEREVIEAAVEAAHPPDEARDIQARDHGTGWLYVGWRRQDGAWQDCHVGTALNSRLARAVDIRDRIRALKYGRKSTVQASMDGDVWQTIPDSTDPRTFRYVRGLPEQQEVTPMPLVHFKSSDPKPDPHAECKLSLVDGVLRDDYGRKLAHYGCVSLHGQTDLKLLPTFVRMQVDLAPPPTDTARPPATQPDPLVLKLDRELTPREKEEIISIFRAEGQSVILLPPHIHRAEHPEEERVRADVAHRVELGAASKRAWRWGVIVGAVVGFAISVGATLVVRYARPEWLVPRPAQERAPLSTPLSTPWSPAAMDEHARESDAAREDAEGR